MKRIFVLYVVLSICAAAFSQIKFPEIKWKSDSLIFIREKAAAQILKTTYNTKILFISKYVLGVHVDPK